MKYTTLLILTLLSINAYTQVETEIESNKILIGSTIEIDGEGVGAGGQVILKDTSGQNKVRIMSFLNTSNRLGGFIDLYNGNGMQSLTFSGHDNYKGGRIQIKDSTALNRIELNSNYNNTGDARIITDEIEIKGGSDLAELFDITSEAHLVLPGYIVSLDPQQPGKLTLSHQAYDKKVAGVISGANGIKPGILMGQDETLATGDDLVTLSGRTYVMANTLNGKIKVGDLITSSDVAGEAMRATSKRKSQGAVIGKAMTELHKGRGYILVLINLQ